MPSPIDPYKSYGQKLISLFAMLLFSKKEHSLIDLSRRLDCSKQSVMRLIENIQMSYGVEIEDQIKGRRKYYRLKQVSGIEPLLQLNQNEIMTLQMCTAFTEHLLGNKLFEEATEALEGSQALLTGGLASSSDFFANFHEGRIDYSSHQDAIRSILNAMDKKKVCNIAYQKISTNTVKDYSVEPLKFFSHQDSMYLHVRGGNVSGEMYYFLLAIHRIKEVKVTDTDYKIPEDYDFDKHFNQNFGVIKHDVFSVTIEFTGYPADYVAERTWNAETRKEWIDENTLILTFKSSSKYELIGWVLSWADNARVLEPPWLVEEINHTISHMFENVNRG